MIKIADKFIEEDQPCFIIAEAGVNHNGDIKLAKKLIDVAAKAGADAVKFQTWVTEDIMTKNSKKVEYQKKADWSSISLYDSIKKLELTNKNFRELYKYAKKKHILFLSTPDDIKSADFLADLGVPAMKLGSGSLTDIRLVKRVAEKNLPVILSTGMSTMNEIRDAVEIVRDVGNDKLILLHCTSNYPAKIESCNLRAMKTLQSSFNTLVGYSDHTPDRATPIAAVAIGAVVLEKHFTIDKNLPGPDHKTSLDPDELKEMVDDIRRTEIILGSEIKKPYEDEEEIRKKMRRSIVAKEDISTGTIITDELLTFKIPGTGLPPKQIHEILGLKAKRNLKKDEQIKVEDLA